LKELASKPFEPYAWWKLSQKLSEYESEKVIGDRPIKGLTMDYIDKCDGEKFEKIIGDCLENQDFNIEYTKRSGDFGVDIIAKRNDLKIAIQIKRYSTVVSRHAVSDVVAGSKYYSCNKSMVITNNYFTKSTIELARKTDTELVDRDRLKEWLE